MAEPSSSPLDPSDHSLPSSFDPSGEIPFAPGEIKRLEKRKWILDYAGKGGIGAEIGVFRGHFSAVLCEELKPRRLYLVDPWTKLGETFGWGKDSAYTGFGRLTTDYARRDAAARVAGFGNVDIRIVEDFAKPFLSGITDQLDWVYLDATHLYEATLGELESIDKVLKPHGVIMGDDWQPGRQHKDHGVYRAIHDFIRSHSYELVAAGPAAQWCLRRAPKVRLNVVKHGSPKVCHMSLGEFSNPLHPGDSFDIGGVVVLETSSPPDGVLRLIHAGDGQEAAKVEWGIPSRGMAVKFPDARNGTISRFACTGIRMVPGDDLEFCLESGDGKRELLWRFSMQDRN
ncbi:MAG: class I SAM-dependent methyltransferase [Verrucomicrobiota bacterium]